MAYMSDIDLATLHKTRLEEKVNYKLSWLAQQKVGTSQASLDYGVSKSKTYNSHRKLTRADTGTSGAGRMNGAVTASKASTTTPSITTISSSSSSTRGGASVRGGDGKIVNNKAGNLNGSRGKQVENKSAVKREQPPCDIYVKNIEKGLIMCDSASAELVDNLSDDGYFSSETRRRRSGTWP